VDAVETSFENLKFPELTETIINLETVNPIEFFGVNNGKLDILKKKIPSSKNSFTRNTD